MFNTILVVLLSFNMFVNNGPGYLFTGVSSKVQERNTGTLEKMIAANGNVAMDLDLNPLNGVGFGTKGSLQAHCVLTWSAILLYGRRFNGELRGTLPGSMGLISRNSAVLPAKLNSSLQRLVFEKTSYGEPYEFVVRDKETGFAFFNIEGHEYGYDLNGRLFSIQMGRLLMSEQFAAELGRLSEVGSIVGQISVSATMRPIEVSQVVDGEVVSDTLPASDSPQPGTVPGPDVVVGDVNGLAQFGSSSGTQVGLALGTDSCNFGTVDLNWFAMPEQRPSGHSAKPLSDERRRVER
jgi:hypothetical protein